MVCVGRYQSPALVRAPLDWYVVLRSLSSAQSDWVAGGTTLQGESSQQFRTAKVLKVDESKAVRMSVRLVGLGSDQLTRREEATVAMSTLRPRRFGK